MTEHRYRRASRKRPCVICGKPDWCSFTPGERISFCARVNSGADRISRYGWGVFYHHDLTVSAAAARPRPSTRGSFFKLAPIEVRDFVYRKLIEFSPASLSDEIVSGPDGLYRRGIFDLSSYGSLPGKAVERNKLAARITGLLPDNFPRFVSGQTHPTEGLPGFWTDGRGRARLWNEHNYGSSLLLIPFIDRNQMIQACQIRFMGRQPSGYSRYIWLSSTDRPGGSGPGSPLHYAALRTSISQPLLVTEGPLKAETVKAFLPDHNVVGNSGVSCSHREIISAGRYRRIEIGFDIDNLENPHVAGALARLLYLRFIDQEVCEYSKDVRILSWDANTKGFDEALLNDLPIKPLKPSEWFLRLAPACRRAVESVSRNITHSERKQFFLLN